MSLYQWLLFDADGTLFDYVTAEAKALRNVFQDFSFPFVSFTETTYRRINSQVRHNLELGTITPLQLRTFRFKYLFSELNLSVDVNSVSKAYLQHLSQQSDIIEGIFPLNQNLAKKI